MYVVVVLVCVWRLFVVKVIKLRPSITWENARGAVCRRLIYRRAIFNDCDGTWHLSCVCCMVVGFRQLGLRVNWGVLYIFMALDFLVGYDSQRSHWERERVHKRCVGVLVFESSSEFRRVFFTSSRHTLLTVFFVFILFFYDLLSACGLSVVHVQVVGGRIGFNYFVLNAVKPHLQVKNNRIECVNFMTF